MRIAERTSNNKELMKKLESFAEPDAIMVLALGISMMYMLATGRKKREAQYANFPVPQVDDVDSVLKIMSVLDSDDCVGLLTCHVATQARNSSPLGRESILNTFRFNSSNPSTWPSLCQSPLGKYHFAMEVGSSSPSRVGESHCKNVFPRCKSDPESLLSQVQHFTRQNLNTEFQGY